MSDFPGVLHVCDLDVNVSVSPRRRSVRLTVERDASVSAVVPPQVSRDELVKVVEAKRSWLYGKLAERRELGESRPDRQYVSGEGFSYLGRSYRLRIVDPPSEVRLVRGRLELSRDGGARELVRWYSRVGEAWLKRRIKPWASRMGVDVVGLRVLPLGYRWGSCSPSGAVNIHWATMQLPPTLVDYVLVHELAHLLRHDHSAEFWRLVERTMPDYEDCRERLRRLGPDLWLPAEGR
ncbi:M48 family metallopeptidase [Streptosporangium lutulentum]|uniref:Metal-dependent hydrolase n=1 Tax=Streptosporangium lutulentum TaxID=1461250 RepID=A0ABT9QC16_9ACTN|nr:SprT family zinc-dependent metalloprotease [Streptosporangium lutulentum]MDP9844305.1 putative metal-dependent hydrolase [Streptosporangium lutulentum]